MVEGAKNPEGAQAFIDFLLSDEVQESIPANMYMYPVNSEISLPDDWAKYAAQPEKPIAVDADEVAADRDAWIKSWTTIYEENAK